MLRSYTQVNHFPDQLFHDIDDPKTDEASLSAAAECLALINTNDAVPYLKKLLAHKSEIVRESAVIGCIDHMRKDIWQILNEMLQTDDTENVKQSINAIFDAWRENKTDEFTKMTKEKFDVTKYFKKIDVLDKGFVELIDGMVTDPNLKVVNSARVSFHKESNEFEEKDKKFTRFLYDHGHFSTFRHSYFSFRIKAPLFVFRQWWKYQVGSNWEHDDLSTSIQITDTSWNEVSGRYVEFQPDFYVPDVFRKQSKNNKQGSEGEIDKLADGSDIKQKFEASIQQSYEVYKELVSAGVAKEISRFMLPQNVYSECIWTCSVQTLVHFFQQRLKDDAQFEIREFAYGIYSLLTPFMGSLIEITDSSYTYLQNKIMSDKQE